MVVTFVRIVFANRQMKERTGKPVSRPSVGSELETILGRSERHITGSDALTNRTTRAL